MPVVQPLINFQNILSVTMGGRFGIFVDDPIGTETIFISNYDLRNYKL